MFISVDIGGRLGIARYVVVLAFPAGAGRLLYPPLSRIVVIGRGVQALVDVRLHAPILRTKT